MDTDNGEENITTTVFRKYGAPIAAGLTYAEAVSLLKQVNCISHKTGVHHPMHTCNQIGKIDLTDAEITMYGKANIELSNDTLPKR